jgi:hypothetical protein
LAASDYGCTINALNCTAIELANKQWGTSFITKFPTSASSLPSDNNVNPSSITIANWGDYPVPGVSKPPEYFYYHFTYFASSADAPHINAEVVSTIMDTHGGWYGFGNIYNVIQSV